MVLKIILVLTYTPQKKLLDSETIQNLTNLKMIYKFNWVNNSVITILDVPFIKK